MLSRLGLADCFESVICFETLNPAPKDSHVSGEAADIVKVTSTEPKAIFDIMGENVQISDYPRTPVVCKPFVEAFEQAFKMANINPQRTVSTLNLTVSFTLCGSPLCACNDCLALLLQLFFDDSIRNIQAGKLVGLHTVLVRIQTKASKFVRVS